MSNCINIYTTKTKKDFARGKNALSIKCYCKYLNDDLNTIIFIIISHLKLCSVKLKLVCDGFNFKTESIQLCKYS